MLMSLPLPSFGMDSAIAKVATIHATEGTLMAAGAALLDLAVDFSGGVTYDCAPITHYRIILRDKGWLLRLLVGPDDDVGPQSLLALLGTEPDEDAGGVPSREARVTLMSILQSDNWWDQPA